MKSSKYGNSDNSNLIKLHNIFFEMTNKVNYIQ